MRRTERDNLRGGVLSSYQKRFDWSLTLYLPASLVFRVELIIIGFVVGCTRLPGVLCVPVCCSCVYTFFRPIKDAVRFSRAQIMRKVSLKGFIELY